MNLKGGIIIIGSLLWDDSKKRKTWRSKYLNEEKKIKIELPIRYGKLSNSRMRTYTMVYSKNLPKAKYGQGIILEFKDNITSIEGIKLISEHTIRVERDKTLEIWKVAKMGEPFVLNWDWGVLGICINPKYKEDKTRKEMGDILDLWKNSLANFCPKDYTVDDDLLMISSDGIFEIDWNKQIEDFDFLISTIIKPDTKTEDGKYPNANNIAEKMYDGNYYSYFIKNIENHITTYDDTEIIELIKSKYCVSNYLENLTQKK